MAIAFARVEIIKAGQGSSAVGLSSYISRDARQDMTTGESYNFNHRDGDLIGNGVMVPDGAPSDYANGERLWNAATAKEMTVDRKTKELRFKKDGQVAKHMVLALPKELTDAERLDLTQRFAKEQFVDKGVAVEWAVHGPDGDNDNHHAHLLISTRELGHDGFGKKARHLNPSFAFDRSTGARFVSDQDHWELKWMAYQNNFFREHGLELSVDPFSAVPEWHKGKGHYLNEGDLAQAITERKQLAKDILQQSPDVILAGVTRNQSTFTERDLDRYLHKHGIAGDDLETVKRKALASFGAVELFDPETGEAAGRYTTMAIRQQEAAIMDRVTAMRAFKRGADPVEVAKIGAARRLDGEQAKALHHATSAEGVAVIEGRAGTGKSYTIGAVRDAYERSGYRVVGLAPTNTVARDMERDGFRHARTVHKELLDIKRGETSWNSRTIVIIDEAAMVDTKRYDALTSEAQKVGAKVILVGDDRQLSSVERGGMFSQVRDHVGSAEISTVRRQEQDWQRTASEDFAAGKMGDGLKAYSDRGHIHWHERLESSRAQLVKDWTSAHASDPERVRFVYASTNVQVDELNKELRQVRRDLDEIGAGRPFKTSRGEIELSTGDRLQFYGNDRKAGIYNGTVGTVTRINGNTVAVQIDGGKRVSFEVGEDRKRGQFNEFGHGYAGTVYRGQGKTQPQVFALYDNRYGWNARTAYVGMTRHKAEVKLYVSRDLAKTEQALARQMARSVEASASIKYATKGKGQEQGDKMDMAKLRQANAEAALNRADLSKLREANREAQAARVTIDNYRDAVARVDASAASMAPADRTLTLAKDARQLAAQLAANNPQIVAETMKTDRTLAHRLAGDIQKGQELANPLTRGLNRGNDGHGY